MQDFSDYHYRFGPSCVGCGQECSGLGVCDDCQGAMCFFCANLEKLGRGYRLCDACLGKREKQGKSK